MPILTLKTGNVGPETIENNQVLIFPGHRNEHHKSGQKLSTKTTWGGGLAKAAQDVTATQGKFALSLPTTGMPVLKEGEAVHPVAKAAIANIWYAIGAGKTLALPVREPSGGYFTESLKYDEGKNCEPKFWGKNEKNPNIILADFYMRHLKVIDAFSKYMDTNHGNGTLDDFLNTDGLALNEQEKMMIQACHNHGQTFPYPDEMPLVYINAAAIESLKKYKADRQATLEKDKQFDKADVTFFSDSQKRHNSVQIEIGESKVNAADKLILLSEFKTVIFTKNELAALLQDHGRPRGNSKLRNAAIELLGKDRVKILDEMLCQMKEDDLLICEVYGDAKVTRQQVVTNVPSH